ncbi:MAG: sodium:solute symporter family protein [Planctomycetota bacterium]
MTLPDWIVLIAYFGVIVLVGTSVGKFTHTTGDFFFGGRRFSWWLVAISCVATLVGSYSFLSYSQSGFNFGLATALPYTNEWFILPLFLLGWLPIIYYNRITSIPEYFERRFDRRTRIVVLILLLIYLEGYVGFNLFTMAKILEGLFGWNMVLSAAALALVSGIYLHAGGQTSVILTDFLQGILLLVVGLGIVVAALVVVGGPAAFWDGLPPGHRLPFAPVNESPRLNAAGDFWNDAMVGTFAFYLINQGVLMRFLSARSVREGRRAMLVIVLVLMPLLAVAVSGAGWIGRSMVSRGQIDPTTSDQIFIAVTRLVTGPGLFGLVVAAVIAALMSTLDTLLSAVSAVAVNDIWRTVRPGRDDAHYLRAARGAAIVGAVVGVGLVPVFNQFESMYQALSHFTSIVTPPLVVVIFLACVWPRFGPRAAFWTLIIGSAAILLSLFVPAVITPFAHGVPGPPEGEYSYMRSLFGLLASGAAAVILTLTQRRAAPPPGLTMSTLREAAAAYKGGDPDEPPSRRSAMLAARVDGRQEADVRLPSETMDALGAKAGDLVIVSDARWWLGGLRSTHATLGTAAATGAAAVLSTATFDHGRLLADRPVRIEKIL